MHAAIPESKKKGQTELGWLEVFPHNGVTVLISHKRDQKGV